MMMSMVDSELNDIRTKLEASQQKIKALGSDLMKAGAPWVEGGILPRN
jgi:hypothetical protein